MRVLESLRVVLSWLGFKAQTVFSRPPLLAAWVHAGLTAMAFVALTAGMLRLRLSVGILWLIIPNKGERGCWFV